MAEKLINKDGYWYGFTGEGDRIRAIAENTRAANGGWTGISIAKMPLPSEGKSQEQHNDDANLIIKAGNQFKALAEHLGCKPEDLNVDLVGLVKALQEIVALKETPFESPSDWTQQIADCPECERYKGHPIQQGICDTHRQPMYERSRHDQFEREAIGPRAKIIARESLATLPHDTVDRADIGHEGEPG